MERVADNECQDNTSPNLLYTNKGSDKMIKFSNCVYVFVFFAIISFLAFFPVNPEKPIQRERDKAELTSPSSSIPQKAGSATANK
jgi:hypothetical protein